MRARLGLGLLVGLGSGTRYIGTLLGVHITFSERTAYSNTNITMSPCLTRELLFLAVRAHPLPMRPGLLCVVVINTRNVDFFFVHVFPLKPPKKRQKKNWHPYVLIIFHRKACINTW